VEHVIWSTLEDSRKWIPLDDKGMPTLQGRYKVPHLDSKAEADVDFRKLPSTLLLTSFYFDNLIMFDMGPKRGPDGKLAFTLPIADARLATIAAEDIGKCAYGIFQLTEAIGEEVGYNYVPPEIFRTLPIPAADDVANMFQFFRDFGDDLCALRSLDFSRSVNPQMQTFGDWLKDNVSRLPIEQKGFRLASSPYSDTPVHN